MGLGICFKYIKISKNGPQKRPAENKKKAGQPDVDSNRVAIASEKHSLFYRKVCRVAFQTEDELNKHSVFHSCEKPCAYELRGN